MPAASLHLRAAVCAVNSQYIHSSLAPWYLAAAAEAYCAQPVSVAVLEHTINQTDEAIIEAVAACPATVIGFSCYIWNIATVKRILPRLAECRPEVIWLLGGPEVSFCPEQVLRELPMVSFVLAGEGERSFARLLDLLAAGGYTDADLSAVAGLCYRTAAGELVTQPPCHTDEEPPSPYTPAYLAALQGRIAYLETSRGCPFSCAFCLSGRQDQVRFFSPERAKQDILLLANAGCRTVKFVDRTFNCHKKRCYDLIQFILSQYGTGIPKGVCFHLEVAADLFDDATLDLLATAPAGAFQIEAGLQSFQPDTLQAVTRKTDVDAICRHIRRLMAMGNIHVHIDLIAGLPREGWAAFGDSFDKAYALQPHMLQLGFLKLLHGSRLRAEAEGHGYVYADTPPYELQSSKWMTADEMGRLHATEDALERLYNSGRFRRTLAYLLAATGWRPFDLFTRFGEYVAQEGRAGMALDEYTALVLEWFSALPQVDSAALRDKMVCDHLQSRRGGLLPPCLRREDPRPRRLIRQLAGGSGRSDGVMRAAAVLYSKEQLVVAEYREEARDPVTGHYPLRFYEMDEIE